MSDIIRSNKSGNREDFNLGGLQKAVDDMFNSFFTGWGPELTRRDNILPTCDFYETEENYCLSMELPGIPKEDVDISVSGDSLIVKGEKKYDNESKEKRYYHRERYYGFFYRSIQFPPNADVDKIFAKFSNGVLHVSIPKSEKHTKKIDIK
ncbi:Hsp20/alpha crystallin family protein [Wolbachia pipientis]|uniref:Hsp20/alpha crystallin family protein n=1 Tax=Wolbachia pipientis TaxID=955 RepID=UPI00202F4539|nr:Hsp20/alpha crystallin family protein [Wolbachia pipientis]MCM1001820.1 Hsp20/alpha crystallin family protein [Wolbachia pipientis]